MSQFEQPKSRSMSPWTFKVIFIGVLVLVIAAAVYLISCVYFIDRNTVGVRVDNGKVVEQLDPGYNFLPSPTETLVRLVTAPTDGEVDGLSVATSDNFAMVETKIKFTRLIHPEDAMSVIKTTPNYEQMIQSAIAQAAKNTIGKYELMEVPESRRQIENDIMTAANALLSKQLPIAGPLQNVVLDYYDWEASALEYLGEVRSRMEKIRTANLEAEAAKIKRREKKAEAELSDEIARIQSAREDENTVSAANAKAEAEAARHTELMRQRKAENAAELTHQRATNEAETEHLNRLAEIVGESGAVALQRWDRWDGQLPQYSGELGLQLRHEMPSTE